VSRLGEILRSRREHHNLTQQELSEKMGFSTPQFISNVERGYKDVSMPVKHLRKLSKILGVKPKMLLDLYAEDYFNKIKGKL